MIFGDFFSRIDKFSWIKIIVETKTKGKLFSKSKTKIDTVVKIDTVYKTTSEFDLESLINEAEESIKEMDSIFDNSDLPNKVNMDLINELLIKIRKEFYGIS